MKFSDNTDVTLKLLSIRNLNERFSNDPYRKKEQVFFFEADLKEAKRDIEGCRAIYTSLQQKKVFEAYLRQIYMEIRTNNIQNVVDVFVSLSQNVQDGDQIAFVVQEMGDILNKLGEVDRAVEIIRQFNDKKTEYSKFFYISWINFLKNCKKPWEEIEAVFKLAFDKIKEVRILRLGGFSRIIYLEF